MCPRCMTLERAFFDEFIRRDAAGRAHFANRVPGEGRFRDRHWPVFQRPKRHAHPRHLPMSPCGEKMSRAIAFSAWLSEARRWLPCNPLDAYAMRVEDAVLSRWAKRKA